MRFSSFTTLRFILSRGGKIGWRGRDSFFVPVFLLRAAVSCASHWSAALLRVPTAQPKHILCNRLYVCGTIQLVAQRRLVRNFATAATDTADDFVELPCWPTNLFEVTL